MHFKILLSFITKRLWHVIDFQIVAEQESFSVDHTKGERLLVEKHVYHEDVGFLFKPNVHFPEDGFVLSQGSLG